MLKKAVPQVKHEYENQKRKLASNRHLAKKGKRKGAERLKRERELIENNKSLDGNQKAALIAELEKKEDEYKKQAVDHAPNAGIKNKLKRFGKKQEDRINRMTINKSSLTCDSEDFFDVVTEVSLQVNSTSFTMQNHEVAVV